jgi:transcription initiation factor TFIID TATA-box-binding protein
MTAIKIENIAAYAKISELLDIEFISEKIPESVYNPDKFDGLSIKSDELKVAAIILSNGKIVCTGAKKIEDAESTIKKIAKQIKDIGFEVKKDCEIQIENITASADLKKEMHLASIANALILQNVDYKPEEFPGLIYRMEEFCTVVLLFGSGKIVCTGAKSIEDAKKAINEMIDKLASIGAL